jgi:hypothetical protein
MAFAKLVAVSPRVDPIEKLNPRLDPPFAVATRTIEVLWLELPTVTVWPTVGWEVKVPVRLARVFETPAALLDPVV